MHLDCFVVGASGIIVHEERFFIVINTACAVDASKHVGDFNSLLYPFIRSSNVFGVIHEGVGTDLDDFWLVVCKLVLMMFDLNSVFAFLLGSLENIKEVHNMHD